MRFQSLILCAVLILAIGCDRPGSSDLKVLAQTDFGEADLPVAKQDVPSPAPVEPVEGSPGDVIAKKIIKDGRMTIEVDDLAASRIQIDSIVRSLDGYYSNETTEELHSELRSTLIIRIPSEQFEKLRGSLGTGIGKVTRNEFSARDVTEEYLDIETRLENKRSVLTRYREILRQAATVEDILNVEEHIRVLEEEIESAEGRLNYLSNKVRYSTLTVVLIKEIPYKYEAPKQAPYLERMKDALASGWKGIKDFILVLLHIWPVMIIVVLLAILWRRSRPNKRRN